MKNKGFSLIELFVVLLIISLSLSLVTPSLSRFSRAIELKATAKKISGILRYCRSEAVNKGQIFQVFFDPNLREVRVQWMEPTEEDEAIEKKEVIGIQKTYALPRGVQFKEFKIASPQFPSDLPMIEFYPNGGSNGGMILLDSPDQKGFRIKIHFLTGMVVVERV